MARRHKVTATVIMLGAAAAAGGGVAWGAVGAGRATPHPSGSHGAMAYVVNREDGTVTPIVLQTGTQNRRSRWAACQVRSW
jgi:hypothetical protein